MMLGRQIRLPIDLALGIPETRISVCESDYAYQLEKQLVSIHDFARKHMQIASNRMKQYYDRNANFTEFEVRDCVWFHNPVRKVGLSLKFQRPWKGPYIITEKLTDVLLVREPAILLIKWLRPKGLKVCSYVEKYA